MVLLFNISKCYKNLYLAALKLHHTSSISFKWPVTLKHTENFQKNQNKPNKPVKVWEKMTVWDLAKSMKQNLDYIEHIIKPRLGKDIEPLTGIINNFDAIKKLLEYQNVDYSVIKSPIKKNKNQLITKTNTTNSLEQTVPKNLVRRPPVVTIMGHVDHGKTTLLDSLRNSDTVSREFGGITQHIGAFSVLLQNGQSITFIDTPGHAAFTSMRARGAEVTDIVILIVSADDGVMEQTIESIRMAKSANVRIIVAVNKIDKGQPDLDEIKQQLLLEGVQAEDLGGDVQVIPISALKKINLDLLIEALLLEAEIMNLTGDPTAPVQGTVIESNIGPRGKVATVIVKQGTLRKSAILSTGLAMARVREIYDENNCKLSEVTLSQPAQIIGWRELPTAGDKVVEVKSEKEARVMSKEVKKKIMQKKIEEDYSEIQKKSVQHFAEYNARRMRMNDLKKKGDIAGLKEMFLRKKEFSHKHEVELNVIVKGDVDGSIEAILDVLNTYNCDDECKLSLISFGVGVVTQSDIDLASTFDAVIYCFNLEFPKNLKDEILRKNIKMRFHNVIYNLIDDIKQEINNLLPPKNVENIVGEAEVIQNFFITEQKKKIPVAGCSCFSGELKKDCLFRIIRKENIIFEGKVKSLKHHKTEVNSIKKGVQCGIMFNDFANEFHPNDKIICFEINQINFPTSWNPGF